MWPQDEIRELKENLRLKAELGRLKAAASRGSDRSWLKDLRRHTHRGGERGEAGACGGEREGRAREGWAEQRAREALRRSVRPAHLPTPAVTASATHSAFCSMRRRRSCGNEVASRGRARASARAGRALERTPPEVGARPPQYALTEAPAAASNKSSERAGSFAKGPWPRRPLVSRPRSDRLRVLEYSSSRFSAVHSARPRAMTTQFLALHPPY